MLLVTGGAGFIGSNFVLSTLAATGEPVVNLDKLTYAGNLANLADARAATRATPSCTATSATARCCASCSRQHQPRAIVHFAAESHVDRSIDGPGGVRPDQRRRHLQPARGGARLLGRARRRAKDAFRFLHVSTDEVYGSLGPRRSGVHRRRRPTRRTAPTPRPRPASDHLVRAYHHTYGLPALTTNCSNNYGPYQFPGEADPAHDPQRARGQAAAGLRRRPATCATGSTSRDHCAAIRAGAREGPRRARPTTSAATREQQQPRRRARALRRCSTSAAAAAKAATRDADHVRHRPPRPRPALRHRRRARSRASSAGRRARPSRRASRRPCAGTSTTPRGSRR